MDSYRLCRRNNRHWSMVWGWFEDTPGIQPSTTPQQLAIVGSYAKSHFRKEVSASKQLLQKGSSKWKLPRHECSPRKPNCNLKLIGCLPERNPALPPRRPGHEMGYRNLENNDAPVARLLVSMFRGLRACWDTSAVPQNLIPQRKARSCGRRPVKPAPGLRYSFWFCKPRPYPRTSGAKVGKEAPMGSWETALHGQQEAETC